MAAAGEIRAGVTLPVKLRRCPHCGKRRAEIRAGDVLPKGGAEYKRLQAIVCMGCGAAGPWAAKLEHAVEGWNRRDPVVSIPTWLLVVLCIPWALLLLALAGVVRGWFKPWIF
jgi:Lar family restriction alleviation protein